MVKAVISGYYGFKNFGDEAILSTLVSHLKTLGVDITVITSNPDYTKAKDDVETVKTFDIKNIIKVLGKTDILVSGGGSLLQDVTSIKSLIYYSFIIFLALVMKKKVIIFAQGIGPLNSKISQIIVKKLLKYASFVSVRDKKSQNILANAGIDAKIVCDPIFSVEIPHTEKEDKVVVQLRNFPTLNDIFLDKLAQNINNNFSDKKIEILSLQDTIDKEICENFNNRLKKLNKDINSSIKVDLSVKDVIQTIAQCKYMVAMRFHAILIGLKAEVKTLAVNYDTKVENLAKEFQLPILNLSEENNFDKEFDTLKNLDATRLLAASKAKTFDWSDFDKHFSN